MGFIPAWREFPAIKAGATKSDKRIRDNLRKSAAKKIKMNKTLRIHSKVSHSRANGPGERAVIWFQGCPMGCPRCFNKGLNNPDEGVAIEIDELFQWVVSLPNIPALP